MEGVASERRSDAALVWVCVGGGKAVLLNQNPNPSPIVGPGITKQDAEGWSAYLGEGREREELE